MSSYMVSSIRHKDKLIKDCSHPAAAPKSHHSVECFLLTITMQIEKRLTRLTINYISHPIFPMLLSFLFLYKIQKMRPKLLFILMIYGITLIIFSLKYQLKLLVDWQSTIYWMQVPGNSS